jgi:hypothetical protein
MCILLIGRAISRHWLAAGIAFWVGCGPSGDDEPELDAGPGEGEGEGEGEVCTEMSYLATLIDDAGMPHYENCPDTRAAYHENDCTQGECVTDDHERAAWEAVLAVALERGFQVEISDVDHGSGDSVYVLGVVVVDWVQAEMQLHVYFESDGAVDIETLREWMPLTVPVAIESLPDAIAELRTCLPGAIPDLCYFSAKRPILAGAPATECGWAYLELWNADWPDAGYDRLYCSTSTVCCPIEAGSIDAGPIDADGGGDPADAGPVDLDGGSDLPDVG